MANRPRGGLLSPSFADALSTLIIIFIALFVLTIIRFNDPSKRIIEQLDYRAAFIIIAEWKDGSRDDVDLWVEAPGGMRISYSNKDGGWINLDRDMQGQNFDASGIARETVHIRKITAGEYVVNVHLYAKRTDGPVPVTIKIVRTIGSYTIVHEETIVLNEQREELTVLRFTLNDKGQIVDKNKLSKRLFR